MFGLEVGLLGLIFLACIIYAVVKTLGSSAGTGAKVIWILVLLVFPLVGFIAWLIFGPRR
ncbi:MAG: PLDc N-terminal domain-containing protein [Alphaproteobacteria bacterium]|nr:PLDc N-terminal domain-containing protein [Alphaproteobacteria bacterium]